MVEAVRAAASLTNFALLVWSRSRPSALVISFSLFLFFFAMLLLLLFLLVRLGFSPQRKEDSLAASEGVVPETLDQMEVPRLFAVAKLAVQSMLLEIVQDSEGWFFCP